MAQTPHTPTRSRERTRERLHEAAREVFAEVGLDAASVEAICDRAGFTRGAFYSNFESKDELFLELAGTVARMRVEVVKERVAELACAGAGSGAPADATAIVQHVLSSSADDRLGVLLMSEIRIHALRNPTVAAAYLAQERDLDASVAQIIRDIARTNGLELLVSAEDAARLLVTVWEGAATRAAMAGADAEQMRTRTGAELAQVVQLIIRP